MYKAFATADMLLKKLGERYFCIRFFFSFWVVVLMNRWAAPSRIAPDDVHRLRIRIGVFLKVSTTTFLRDLMFFWIISNNIIYLCRIGLQANRDLDSNKRWKINYNASFKYGFLKISLVCNLIDLFVCLICRLWLSIRNSKNTLNLDKYWLIRSVFCLFKETTLMSFIDRIYWKCFKKHHLVLFSYSKTKHFFFTIDHSFKKVVSNQHHHSLNLLRK